MVSDSEPAQVKTFHRTTYPAVSPARPELSTKGKTAFITGGGSGIGASIAKAFAQSGITHLGILGRSQASLLQTKADIQKVGPNTTVWTYSVDLANPDATSSALSQFAASTQGKIDILVANAGYMPELATVADADPDDWWQSFEISVRGNFNLLRAFHPHAAEQATVLHISTAAVYIPAYDKVDREAGDARKLFSFVFSFVFQEWVLAMIGICFLHDPVSSQVTLDAMLEFESVEFVSQRMDKAECVPLECELAYPFQLTNISRDAVKTDLLRSTAFLWERWSESFTDDLENAFRPDPLPGFNDSFAASSFIG